MVDCDMQKEEKSIRKCAFLRASSSSSLSCVRNAKCGNDEKQIQRVHCKTVEEELVAVVGVGVAYMFVEHSVAQGFQLVFCLQRIESLKKYE